MISFFILYTVKIKPVFTQAVAAHILTESRCCIYRDLPRSAHLRNIVSKLGETFWYLRRMRLDKSNPRQTNCIWNTGPF